MAIINPLQRKRLSALIKGSGSGPRKHVEYHQLKSRKSFDDRHLVPKDTRSIITAKPQYVQYKIQNFPRGVNTRDVTL